MENITVLKCVTCGGSLDENLKCKYCGNNHKKEFKRNTITIPEIFFFIVENYHGSIYLFARNLSQRTKVDIRFLIPTFQNKFVYSIRFNFKTADHPISYLKILNEIFPLYINPMQYDVKAVEIDVNRQINSINDFDFSDMLDNSSFEINIFCQ